jgi:hypothetical protein
MDFKRSNVSVGCSSRMVAFDWLNSRVARVGIGKGGTLGLEDFRFDALHARHEVVLGVLILALLFFHLRIDLLLPPFIRYRVVSEVGSLLGRDFDGRETCLGRLLQLAECCRRSRELEIGVPVFLALHGEIYMSRTGCYL